MKDGEIDRVRDTLKTCPKGITIAELAKLLNLNRLSTSKYLNMLQASGDAEMRIFGPSKVFYPCLRIPLSAILNFSTSHLLVMDDNLTIIDANDVLLRFFAVEKEDLVGHRIDYSPIAGFVDSTIMLQLERALESHDSTLEIRITVQGKDHVLKTTCIPTVFESGDHGVSLISEDITELTQYRVHLEQLVDERAKELQKTNEQLITEIKHHKKARIALKNSEIKYRELVENANSIILRTDLEGIIEFFNEFAQHFFGYTENEVLGKSLYDTIVPATGASGKNIREIRQEMRLDPDNDGNYEGENVKKNGERVWISWTNKLIRNDEGIVTGMLSIGNDITGRRRAEDALKASEERFRLAMEASSDGIWDWDITTDNGYFSPAYYRMLGYEPGKFPSTGQTWVTLIHPDDRKRTLCINQDCIENRCQSFEIEYRLKAKDGTWKWILGRGKAVSRDAGGRALRIIGTHVDITGRRQAEDALRASEERFRLAMEASSDGIWDGDFTTGTGYLSPAYYRMLGYEPGEFPPIYQVWVTLLHPDDKEHALSINQDCIENRCQSFEGEFRLKAKDGSWRWVLCRARAVSRDAGGRALRIIGTHVDITGRKQAEDVLKASEARFHELADLLPQGIYEADTRGNLKYSNRIAHASFGYTDDDFWQGLTIMQMITPDDRARAVSAFCTMGEGECGEFPNEYLAMRKDGSTFPISIYSSPIVVNDRITGIRGIIVDITERKKSEEALTLVNRKLNLLSSITRHDIINQLMVLKGYLELIKLKTDNPELLDYIGRCDHATRNIDRQITFTRNYQDLGVKAPSWQNIRSTIIEAKGALPLGNVTIDMDRHDLEVFADPLFEKVFCNLIDNSLKYGGDQLRIIRISAQERDNCLVITYDDDGVGIADADKARIFERGFGNHTGFGLFLSREILSITGITITETGVPGDGARFEIVVPKGMWRVSGPSLK